VHDLPPELEPDNERPGLGMGEEADADFMQSTVGLVWRSLVLSLLVLALVLDFCLGWRLIFFIKESCHG